MADPPPYPGTPHWVKISGIVVGVLGLLAVILMLAGGGRHGPGRHISSDAGGRTLPLTSGLMMLFLFLGVIGINPAVS